MKHKPIPADYVVQPLKFGQFCKDRRTCLHCGLSWDDSVSTSLTPTPGARCPFEPFHVEMGSRMMLGQVARFVGEATDSLDLTHEGLDEVEYAALTDIKGKLSEILCKLHDMGAEDA